MISLKDAYNKAKGLKEGIDICSERENAYVFGRRDDDTDGASPVVIMKDTGEAKSMSWYTLNAAKKRIRTVPIEELI